jgi:hypothetical protein
MAVLAELGSNRVRINRMPRNFVDKTTIISVFPWPIIETKVTLQPSEFRIEAAPEDGYSSLVVGCAFWLKEMELDVYQEMYVPSEVLAKSIINDYTSGLLGAQPERGPGLFILPGSMDTKSKLDKYISEDLKSFSSMLEAARARQKAWYIELVRMTDAMWARTNGNPVVVSDHARLACTKLSLTREWITQFQTMEKTNCKACGHLINPAYPVCSNCKSIINPDKAKELGIVFAS